MNFSIDNVEVSFTPTYIMMSIKNIKESLGFHAVLTQNNEFIANIAQAFDINETNIYSSNKVDYLLKNKIATLEGVIEHKNEKRNSLIATYILKLTKSFIKKCMLKDKEVKQSLIKSKETIKMPSVKQNQFSAKLSKDKGWLFIKDKFGEVVRQLYVVNYIKSKSKNIYFYFQDEKRDDQILKFLIKSQTAKLVRTSETNDITYYELKLLNI